MLNINPTSLILLLDESVLGIVMACSPIFAFIYTAIRQRHDSYRFYAETAGIYSVFNLLGREDQGNIVDRRTTGA